MNFTANRFGVKASITLASSLVVLTGALASQRVFAQDAQTDQMMEEVIVTGVRTSLENAQDIKREADTFVDAISASDIGALPDRSVLEAMQRLPGVSIERFAAANDPDHFGVEGSGAVVRGMSQTRSEFNGRDSFTANSGRGLSFQDVPPELMGGVDMFKNQTADMIEGGVGGTVNLKTRKPFDNRGLVAALSADVTYGDMVEESTPTFSGIFSNTWDSDVGEFGFLLNASYSELSASSHGIQTDLFEYRSVEPTGIWPGFPNAAAAGFDNVWVPNGSNITMKKDDRERKGVATAFQWENPDDTLVATVQFMRSDATLAWTEHALKYQSGYYTNTTFPPDGQTFEFDDNGIFTNGTFTDIRDGWRGDGNRIPHNLPPDAGWGGQPVRNFGMEFQTDARSKDQRTVVDDLAFNIDWDINDSWNMEFDLQRVEAETTDDDVQLMLGTRAAQHYDIYGGGDTPTLEINDPWEYYDGADDLVEWDDNPAYFQDETSYFWRSAMDHYERSEGESTAARVDFTHYLDGDFFTQVKFGARRAEREQQVRFSQYNWGQLQAPWGPPIYERDADGNIVLGNPDDPTSGLTIYPNGAGWLDAQRVIDAGLGGMDAVDVIDWDNFFRGGVVNIEGGNQLFHPSMDLVMDYRNWDNRLGPISNEWVPANSRDPDKNGTIDTVNGSFFLPSEINTVEENNTAAYVRFDFEGDFGKRFVGNFGLRYVKIDRRVLGSIVLPNLRPEYPIPEGFDMDAYRDDPYGYYIDGLDPRAVGDYRNFLPQADADFATGVAVPSNTKSSENHLLPSFNLKVELTDDLIGRFAVAKAIALPDMGDLRAYRSMALIGYAYTPEYFPNDMVPGTFNPDDVPEERRAVNPDSIDLPGYKAEGGNPDLKAMESIQFDLSLEWYFSSVGSLTTSLFYKDLSNFFVNGGQNEVYTNPDTQQSMPVVTAMTRNQGAGSLQGVEFAYQQFFDMLPEPWDGLGVQFNYSFIDAEGAPNYDDVPDEVNFDPETAREVNFTDLPLQGQSEHTSNAVLMYEKDKISARVAYNWRSEYLLTTRDVITKLPIYNDDAGFMDASFFYNITDNFKIGVQGVNLLDTQTKTYAQVDDNGTRVGRSWFINDRRYSLVLRANF